MSLAVDQPWICTIPLDKMDKSVNIPDLLFTHLWRDSMWLLILGASVASEQPCVSAVHVVTWPDVWQFHYRIREATGNVVSSTVSLWSRSHSFLAWASSPLACLEQKQDHPLCAYLCRHTWSGGKLEHKGSQA